MNRDEMIVLIKPAPCQQEKRVEEALHLGELTSDRTLLNAMVFNDGAVRHTYIGNIDDVREGYAVGTAV
jgi:hypothetical protein